MNLLKLGWKNLVHQPWSTTLSLVLAALGAGLISLMLQLNHQLSQQFERNLAGVDLVLGAKGSPLQLILSGMYHIDAPTGNIPIADCKAFLNPKHPLIQTAIPLSLGDSYQGHRIVGTKPEFLGLYEAMLAEGRVWKAPLEVVAGAAVARKLKLKLGDTFHSSHGFVEDEDLVHADAGAFRVVGVLQSSGSVADQLLLTSNESLWVVHEGHAAPAVAAPEPASPAEEHDHDHAADTMPHDQAEEHNHDHDHDHADGHDHDHADEPADEAVLAAFPPDKPLTEYLDRDITMILIKFKGRNAQTLNMPRNINENTNMQAAVPAIEINRLYATMGAGERTLRWMALVIIGVSILSIFISLYANLNNRRYELALLRVMGASRARLFLLLLLEGVLLATVGCLLGLLLSHGGMALLAGYLSEAYRYDFEPLLLLPSELGLLVGAVLLGALASLLPASQASRTDIHTTLAE